MDFKIIFYFMFVAGIVGESAAIWLNGTLTDYSSNTPFADEKEMETFLRTELSEHADSNVSSSLEQLKEILYLTFNPDRITVRVYADVNFDWYRQKLQDIFNENELSVISPKDNKIPLADFRRSLEFLASRSDNANLRRQLIERMKTMFKDDDENASILTSPARLDNAVVIIPYLLRSRYSLIGPVIDAYFPEFANISVVRMGDNFMKYSVYKEIKGDGNLSDIAAPLSDLQEIPIADSKPLSFRKLRHIVTSLNNNHYLLFLSAKRVLSLGKVIPLAYWMTVYNALNTDQNYYIRMLSGQDGMSEYEQLPWINYRNTTAAQNEAKNLTVKDQKRNSSSNGSSENENNETEVEDENQSDYDVPLQQVHSRPLNSSNSLQLVTKPSVECSYFPYLYGNCKQDTTEEAILADSEASDSTNSSTPVPLSSIKINNSSDDDLVSLESKNSNNTGKKSRTIFFPCPYIPYFTPENCSDFDDGKATPADSESSDSTNSTPVPLSSVKINNSGDKVDDQIIPDDLVSLKSKNSSDTGKKSRTIFLPSPYIPYYTPENCSDFDDEKTTPANSKSSDSTKSSTPVPFSSIKMNLNEIFDNFGFAFADPSAPVPLASTNVENAINNANEKTVDENEDNGENGSTAKPKETSEEASSPEEEDYVFYFNSSLSSAPVLHHSKNNSMNLRDNLTSPNAILNPENASILDKTVIFPEQYVLYPFNGTSESQDPLEEIKSCVIYYVVNNDTKNITFYPPKNCSEGRNLQRNEIDVNSLADYILPFHKSNETTTGAIVITEQRPSSKNLSSESNASADQFNVTGSVAESDLPTLRIHKNFADSSKSLLGSSSVKLDKNRYADRPSALRNRMNRVIKDTRLRDLDGVPTRRRYNKVKGVAEKFTINRHV